MSVLLSRVHLNMPQYSYHFYMIKHLSPNMYIHRATSSRTHWSGLLGERQSLCTQLFNFYVCCVCFCAFFCIFTIPFLRYMHQRPPHSQKHVHTDPFLSTFRARWNFAPVSTSHLHHVSIHTYAYSLLLLICKE